MYPKKLKKGDEIRIIAPSKSMRIIDEKVVLIAKKRLEEMGFKITFGKNVLKTSKYYDCASISERVSDIHDAFLDKNVKAILTVVGGYSINQILKYIDYNVIKKNPKILCGFSDITALQNAIYKKTNLIVFSGNHFSNFGMKYGFEFSKLYFEKMLMEENKSVLIESSKFYSNDLWYIDQENRKFKVNKGMNIINNGEAIGKIIGGNLCTLNLLQGTAYMPSLENSILFLEDTGNLNSNYLLEFDRNLESLIQLPDFKYVKGIVFGKTEDKNNMSIEKWKIMINNKKELKKIPIIINANFGHIDPIITFPIGGDCYINAQNNEAKIWINNY